jgi:dipeptidase
LWFGKNSDREPNEAHEVLFVKGLANDPGTKVKCTYLEIPEVPQTFDVILCKPVWMWGAEMGVNSHGVAIGNEAVFTRGRNPEEPALTGMDLLRLALQRSTSARGAVDCITGLLTTYGQGGNCGFSHPFYYNNSFLIADRKETWVLETVGRDWAVKKFVTSTAISNALTLRSDWDEVSPGLRDLHDLAGQKSDPIVTRFSQAVLRRDRVMEGLIRITPGVSIKQAFDLLRSHHGSASLPRDSLTANTVCMHAGFGPIRIDQTTGSFVVDFHEDQMVVWITGTSAPCLSVFHPVLLNGFRNDTRISTEEDWRENETLHRNAIFCSDDRIQIFQSERDVLENDFIADMTNASSMKGRMDIVELCQRRRQELLTRWGERFSSEKKVKGHFFYRRAWRTFNKEANFQNDL